MNLFNPFCSPRNVKNWFPRYEWFNEGFFDIENFFSIIEWIRLKYANGNNVFFFSSLTESSSISLMQDAKLF